MAATPLFNTDEASVKAILRLTSMASTDDGQAIFEQVVSDARIRIYRTLGVARVTAILTTALTDTPTTDDEVLRALAASVEIKAIYCRLLRMLPNTFMDASGDVDKRWNEEAPIRERGFSELGEELRRCENEIVSDLAVLAEPSDDGCDQIQVYDGSPDTAAPRIGLTLKQISKTNLFAQD